MTNAEWSIIKHLNNIRCLRIRKKALDNFIVLSGRTDYIPPVKSTSRAILAIDWDYDSENGFWRRIYSKEKELEIHNDL